MVINNPSVNNSTQPFIHKTMIGSFKIEKLLIAGSFTACKQYSVAYCDIKDDRVQAKFEVRLKGVKEQQRNHDPYLLFTQGAAFEKLMHSVFFEAMEIFNLHSVQVQEQKTQDFIN